MKKILLFSSMLTLIASFAFSQSPRVILYEEFTGENCGPCAAANPTLNTLLSANPTSTILSLKYESPIPSSAGPNSIYGANTTDVDARITYYTVPFAPYGRLDGFEQVDASGAGNDGHISFLTQSSISTRSASTSPFTLALSHSFKPMYDSVTVTAVITASQAFTAFGALKFRLALVEKEIHLAAATGSNGEKDFFSTMRKMIPNSAGTVITGNWTNAQTSTLTFTIAVPSYVYDLSQIGFIGFIQDDGNNTPGTYSIQQAGYSAPVPVPSTFIDGGINNTTVAPATLCTTSVTPTFTLDNITNTTLTSATVGYSINGGTPVTQNWTGSLLAGNSATITFPAATVSSGSNSLVGTIISLNGGAVDFNKANNTTTAVTFNTMSPTPSGTSIAETFEAAAVGAAAPSSAIQINPYGAGAAVYVVDKSINTSVTQKLGGFGNSDKSFRWKLPSFLSGDILSLVFNKINLTGKTNCGLEFSRAYARTDGTSADVLSVKVSTDCGANYTTVYTKSASALATGADNSSTFFYPTPTEWVKEVVSLKAFDNAPDVLINFEVTTGGGNNLYIDDVNVDANKAPNGVENTSSVNASINVYPNPATDKLTLSMDLQSANAVSYSIINSIGQVVLENSLNNNSNTVINVANLASGNYIIKVKTTTGVTTNKFVKD